MITPTRLSVLSLLLTGAATLSAQTHAPVHHAATTAHTATTHAAAGPAGCAKDVPELSPKIPALPAGDCPKVLYTITTTPSVKLDYVSPMEGPDLRTTLGLEGSSFSELYVDTKVGSGPLAEPHKWYTIHYTGYLTDGVKFDSSLDRKEPININYGQHMVIPGWDTGFGGMHIGGKRRLYIPYELAYGPNGKPPTIPAKSELIFDVELLAQSDARPEPPAKPAAQPASSDGKPGATAQPSAAPITATPRAVVMSYLSAAKYKASDWSFSISDTTIDSETIDAKQDKATIVAHVVFKGRGTYMSVAPQTFSLVMENGTWRITGTTPPKLIDPADSGASPL
ncbi:MAG TPA: FKBP-type peptidyl-prolyl cis-trans isomerase [Acidobacteriaceae bacterium]|nr:FKBP-type peptidyl-prolyl cis-trans isomerase [Acidobacteriaceae bacterium]